MPHLHIELSCTSHIMQFLWNGMGRGYPVVAMLRLHYVPGSHGSPVCPKRSAPWDFGQFFLRIQVLLGLAKFSHGLSRYPWRAVGGRGCWVPEAQRHITVRSAVYHGCQYVPSRPVTFWWGPSRFSRSDQGPTRFSRSVKAFYGWNVDAWQLWSTFVPTV